jgi:ribosomal protein S18 acetylase RimI-like enzyme
VTLIPAAALPRADLLALFNLAYSDYLVPLALDERAFAEHLACYDVDLDGSRVLVDPAPAALALVARRGAAGWVAGVGTAPDQRRRGLAARALRDALQAAHERGCATVDLEVIDANRAAIALYEQLGFTTVRDLLVWSLAASGQPPPDSRRAQVPDAQAWIAAHRRDPDPWQRSPATVEAIRVRGGELGALVIEADGETTAAVLWREHIAQITVLQVAATDEAAARQALLAAARGERDLRLTNVEVDDPASLALRRLGARLVACQHEMRIAL